MVVVVLLPWVAASSSSSSWGCRFQVLVMRPVFVPMTSERSETKHLFFESNRDDVWTVISFASSCGAMSLPMMAVGC